MGNKNQGEGNKEAAQRYNKEVQASVDAGVVDDEEHRRKNINEAERKELEEAEKKGKARAAEEDPAVNSGKTR